MLAGVVQIATAELQVIWAHLIQIPITGLTKYVKEEHSKQ